MSDLGIQGIDHLALQLPSLEEGCRFFQQLLGLKLKRRVTFEGMQIVMLQAGKVELEMWQAPDGEDKPTRPPACGVDHIGLLVRDLDRALAHLRQAGVPILTEVYEPTAGIREVIVQGPGGVRLQLVEQDVPRLIWRSLRGEFKES